LNTGYRRLRAWQRWGAWLRRASLPVLLLGLLATACRSADPDQRTIVFSYGVGAPVKERLLNELIDGFEAEQRARKDGPAIKVHRHSIAGITDTDRSFYLTSLGAGSRFVDVFEMDLIWLPAFAAGGLLLDLAAHVDEADRSALLPAAVEGASYQGQLRALPWYLTLGALYHRPSLLQKHGLQPPATWDQLVSQAQKLGEAEGIDGLLWQGRRYEGLTCVFLERYHNLGGELRVEPGAVRFDEAVLRETLTQLHATIHQQKISPAAVQGYTELDAAHRFGAGKAAFMRAWQTQILDLAGRTIGDDFAVTPPPDRGASMVGGALLGINARTQYPEAALSFARYWQSAEVQRRLAETLGYAPVRAEMYAPETAASPRLATIRALAQNVRFRPRSPHYHELTVMLMQQVHAVVRGEASPEQATRAILERSAGLELPARAGPDFPAQLLKIDSY